MASHCKLQKGLWESAMPGLLIKARYAIIDLLVTS